MLVKICRMCRVGFTVSNDYYSLLNLHRSEKTHQPDIQGIEETHKTKTIILSKFTMKSVKLPIRLFVAYLVRRL